ncbi:MAG: M48 family metalloprotease [Pseudomonadota bacterium]|uniref:M48 family metalloprotease n=1 Tax=Candidatus Desulfatibia profunda TaxID=2841695 RepID=A0A8J6NZ29_9BACT|nr:M48 family metalloprotease [Candidatus Desulfatibia profunda]MBL7179330.1 M48 family metalloprotease [Desulfobacterales bacterium]
MFSNFIYFIIVLLIYSTYQPSENTNFTALETLFLFVSLIIVFAGVTWVQFHRIEKQIATESFAKLDHKFHAALTRQSVMAIVLFSLDIYGLNLVSFTLNLPFLSMIPTLRALLFLGLFVFYLAIVWAFAHAPYQRLYTTDLSKESYIRSNISFSVPVLLPWLLLSGIADIINALPFQLPKRLLATTEGQVLYFMFFLMAIAMIGPLMIQKFWRCKPLETGYVRERIENVCRRADLEYANILYWPIFGGRMITAGVMGLVKKFRYILVTGAFIRFLEPEEIDAVIAHEIGHIKKKHLWFYLVFFVGYMLISYATFDLLVYAVLYAEPLYRFISRPGLNQTTVTSTIFSLAIIVIFLIYFRFIFGYFMRNFERQADTYVYALFDSAGPLISTLEKIVLTSGQPADRPNWHHYSIKKRIDYLKQCEADKTWISRHDWKIKKSIAVYLAGILFIGAMGYHLNYSEAGKRLNTHFFETIIQREIEKTPENSDLYSILGDLYYSNRNYAQTIEAYERAIRLKPDNPKALNNLAWLLATCEDKRFLDPGRALDLAQKAAELEKAPHILDTLAESYYVNGMYAAAVATEMQALDLVTMNRSYYKKQLKKFTDAANKARPMTAAIRYRPSLRS